MKRNDRNNNFVTLHYLGLVLVILGHQFILLGSNALSILNVEIHNLGVRILFVVSGYLVMGSMLRTEKVSSFLKKRLFRIFPGLVICVLGEVFIIGPLFTELPLKTYFEHCTRFLVRNILLCPVFDLPGVFGANPYANVVNGSLWTLPIEFGCYILMAMQAFVIRKVLSNNKKIAKGIIFVEFAVVYILYIVYELGIISPQWIVWGTDWARAIVLVVYFMLGCIISIFQLEIFDLRYAILFVILYMTVPPVAQTAIRPFVVSYFVISFALTPMTKLSEYLERYNLYYSGYLWAFPVQQIIVYLLLVKYKICSSPYILSIISMVCIIIVAWVMTELVEKKFLNFIEISKKKMRWGQSQLKEKV